MQFGLSNMANHPVKIIHINSFILTIIITYKGDFIIDFFIA